MLPVESRPRSEGRDWCPSNAGHGGGRLELARKEREEGKRDTDGVCSMLGQHLGPWRAGRNEPG